MRRCFSLVGLLSLLLFLGVTPATFEFKTYKDFSDGDAKGVSIGSVGTLTLAMQSVKIADLEEATVWALLSIGDHIYVASGDEGKVTRFGAGEPVVVFTSPEPFVYALEDAGNRSFFAASSPDGKVYLVKPDGSSSVFFEPQTKYIWALALDRDQNLWVATGNPGKLIKVSPNGSPTVMYETGDDQIRSIAISDSGTVYFGTSGEGIIYRLEREGKAFALYDSDYTEIIALYADPLERIFALATSGRAEVKRKESFAPDLSNFPIPSAIASQVESMMEEFFERGEPEKEEGQKPPAPPRGRSALLEINSNGSWQIVWKSNRDSAYAMAPTQKGTYILGTGENGNLLEVDARGNETLLAHLEEKQINNVYLDSSNRILIATSNPGAVYSFSPDPVKQGTYTSRVLDAGGISQWGVFRVTSKPAFGAHIDCFTRSGNTREITPTWSDWEPIRAGKIGSPSARFIQWKCELTVREQDVPVLTSVEISYMLANLPPKVSEVKVLPPGPPRKAPEQPTRPREVGEGGFLESAQEFIQQTISSFPGMGSDLEGTEEGPPSPPYPGRPPTATRPGWRTVTWKASDPNGDQLKYDLYYRMIGESNWKLLKENLKVTRYSWDTSGFPDGRYELRVVAKDDLANPAPVALSDELITDPFIIDNTPPEVLNLKAVIERNKAVVTFMGSDRWFPLDGSDYAVDAGDWNVILPTDGIPDDLQEHFAFTTAELTRGEHTIVVRVRDLAQNAAYASITVSVP